MPLLMALCVVIGIVIGTFYANHFSGNRLNIINSGSNRLNNLLHIIDDQYVDTVNINDLVEKAIPQIVSELDPHSAYISAAEAQNVVDDLKGSFFGVGIEFVIREDTIHVQNVIADGPAERAGLLAGDKIVAVDGKKFVGKEVTSEEAQRRLKGEKGSKVKVGVLRYGCKKVLEYSITRDEIKTKSVSAVDLRDNTGGYLESAVQMANEFLPSNSLIVYTEGRKSPRRDYRSDGRGSYQKIPLVVLINENSASASEIFAGAMQDNDRAKIIGIRSFGKGLVQQQLRFHDGSIIRLTVARYYTPSGRCIQKPYVAGEGDNYSQDIVARYKSGEFFSQDSIKHTGPKFHTKAGRVVYGGGGITPDIFVAEDTTSITSYYTQAAASGLILQFAFTYTDANRLKLNNFKEMQELANYLVKQNTVELFADYANSHGLQRRNLMIRKSHALLERYINSRIIYNMLNEQAWHQYLNQKDPVINAALKVFGKKK